MEDTPQTKNEHYRCQQEKWKYVLMFLRGKMKKGNKQNWLFSLFVYCEMNKKIVNYVMGEFNEVYPFHLSQQRTK